MAPKSVFDKIRAAIDHLEAGESEERVVRDMAPQEAVGRDRADISRIPDTEMTDVEDADGSLAVGNPFEQL